MIRALDSVVFATPQLKAVRAFYADLLGLTVGTFEKDGRTLPDEDDRYVNFRLGPVLLGF